MILCTSKIKDACNTIFLGVDVNGTSFIRLIAKNNKLSILTNNNEFFVRVNLPSESIDDFDIVVAANEFLKLVNQTTSESIELRVMDSLKFIGNGIYDLDIVSEQVNPIELINVTVSFDMDGNNLDNIRLFNLKQFSTGVISVPVQKLCYMDEKGAITFTSGACVNNFTLPKPVKVLFTQKVIKLFKLFKDSIVKFSLAHDAFTDDIIQSKVSFETEDVFISVILPGLDDLLPMIPVDIIRNHATTVYKHQITLNKSLLLDCFNRISLFSINDKQTNSKFAKFQFNSKFVEIEDADGNEESVYYENKVDSLNTNYSTEFDLNTFITILTTCKDTYITLSFGNGSAAVISSGNINSIIPERDDE